MGMKSEDSRKNAIEQFLKEAGKKCRIGGYYEGKRSHIWTIANDKHDLYVAQDGTKRSLKMSLHGSGRFRLAFQNEYHQGLIDRGLVDTVANRAITVWDRPAGNGSAARLVVSMLLPAMYYEIDLNPADFTKATSLFKVEPGNALEIGIFHSERFTEDLEGKLANVGKPIWYADLDGAGTFTVVVRQRAFDPTAFLPQEPMTLPARAIHNPAKMPTDEKPVKTGLRALIFNDPVKEGVLRVIEVARITLSKGS